METTFEAFQTRFAGTLRTSRSKGLKIIFCLGFIFQAITATAQHTKSDYDSIATIFTNELICCPLQVEAGDKHYTSMQAGADGLLSFHGENGASAQTNLFALYKTQPTDAGFYHKDFAVVFQVAEKNDIILRGDSAHVQRIFLRLEQLFQAGKDNYQSSLKLNLKQTVDSINLMLKKWVYYKPSIMVSANGMVHLRHAGDQYFNFDFNLLSGSKKWRHEVRGIALDFAHPRAHTNDNWINFKQDGSTVAFIKFNRVPDSVLNQLHRLFVHASTLTKVDATTAGD